MPEDIKTNKFIIFVSIMRLLKPPADDELDPACYHHMMTNAIRDVPFVSGNTGVSRCANDQQHDDESKRFVFASDNFMNDRMELLQHHVRWSRLPVDTNKRSRTWLLRLDVTRLNKMTFYHQLFEQSFFHMMFDEHQEEALFGSVFSENGTPPNPLEELIVCKHEHTRVDSDKSTPLVYILLRSENGLRHRNIRKIVTMLFSGVSYDFKINRQAIRDMNTAKDRYFSREIGEYIKSAICYADITPAEYARFVCMYESYAEVVCRSAVTTPKSHKRKRDD